MQKSAIIQRSELGWQAQLRNAISSVPQLCEILEIDVAEARKYSDFEPDWPIRAPLSFVQRMRVGDANDPLLRQVLPLKVERKNVSGYISDPLGEANATPQPGIVHKYKGRALFVATGSCAVHCRYCFRREFDYENHKMSRQKRKRALTYFKEDTSLSEIILSGGDPLMLTDKAFYDLCDDICNIQSIKRLRIHTRLPVVIPARLHQDIIQRLAQLPIPVVLVVHINHTNEISHELGLALRSSKAAGLTVLNQSVLLAGVNDSSQDLIDLSLRLFDYGAMPYYVHLTDPVTGTAHFDVDINRASAIMGEVANALPGYLVPKLVKEQAGLTAKQSILASL